MKTFAILNGPNLDRLGKREPEIYGNRTWTDIESDLNTKAKALGVKIECFQSNHEGVLIDTIAKWADAGVAGLIVNPGGFTHTSVALRDAIAGAHLPTVEVHLSQTAAREDFRHHSFISPVVLATITGMGEYGYTAALEFLSKHLSD